MLVDWVVIVIGSSLNRLSRNFLVSGHVAPVGMIDRAMDGVMSMLRCVIILCANYMNCPDHGLFCNNDIRFAYYLFYYLFYFTDFSVNKCPKKSIHMHSYFRAFVAAG